MALIDLRALAMPLAAVRLPSLVKYPLLALSAFAAGNLAVSLCRRPGGRHPAPAAAG